jgi:hypothetical protein
MLPNIVHDPVCGLVTENSMNCQPFFYSEDFEYLNVSIPVEEVIFGVTEKSVSYYDNWTILGICGICGLALALLAYFCLEVYKTCCQGICCYNPDKVRYSAIK